VVCFCRNEGELGNRPSDRDNTTVETAFVRAQRLLGILLPNARRQRYLSLSAAYSELDVPVVRDGSVRDGAFCFDLQAVHLPDIDPSTVVALHNVAVAIAIEVAGTLDRPMVGNARVRDGAFHFYVQAIHLPDMPHRTTIPERPRTRRDHRRGFLRRCFRKRTPGPPPFSEINLAPPPSNACLMRERASSETAGPFPRSTRFIVGKESPARFASSDCDHPRSARAALICSIVITSQETS
jgi:hypothetical protein